MKTQLKKSLLKNILIFISIFFLVFLQQSCSNQEEEPIETFKSIAGPGGGVVIHRKYKWKITSEFQNCVSGRGLCISGPTENDKKDVFSGYLAKNGEDEVIIYFNNDLMDGNDLFSNDSLFIESNVSINEEFCKIMKFDRKDIIKGKYKIEKSDTKFDLSVNLKVK